VEVGHPARDRKAEAGAPTLVAGEGAEAFEDALAVVGSDAGTRVGHLEAPGAGASGGSHRHDPAGRAVPGGVVEQVGDELAQSRGVGEHGEPRGRRDVVGDTSRGRRAGADEIGKKGRHVEVRESQRCHPGVDPRQVEEVVDEATEPASLRQHAGQGVVVGRLDAVGKILETRRECGHRGAQLVRDGRDQRPALRVDVAEVGGHLVERAGQLAHLVTRRRLDATGVVTARHPARHLGHLPQRTGHAGRQQLGHAQRDRDRHRHRQPRGHSPGRADRADDRSDDHARGHQQAELHLDRGDPAERLAGHGVSRA